MEGIYGWLAVNFLKGGFKSRFEDASSVSSSSSSSSPLVHPSSNPSLKQTLSFGFLDMGGASAQIAFEPSPYMVEQHPTDLTSVKLRTMSGAEFSVSVFVTTFLGFGANEARRRFVKDVLVPSSKVVTSSSSSDSVFSDPCLPLGLSLSDTSPSSPLSPSPSKLTLSGSGNLEKCLTQIYPVLNKTVPCSDNPCLLNGVHAPIVDFNNHRFLGVSEYWYSAYDVFHLGGEYSYNKYVEASKQFCSTPWSDIKRGFEEGRYPSVKDMGRLEMQCFKSAWLLSFLHEGLGVPKEPQSLSSFQSVNSIGDFSLSWTLGAILLFAASTTISSTSPGSSTTSTISSSYYFYHSAFALFTLFSVVLLLFVLAALPPARRGQSFFRLQHLLFKSLWRRKHPTSSSSYSSLRKDSLVSREEDVDGYAIDMESLGQQSQQQEQQQPNESRLLADAFSSSTNGPIPRMNGLGVMMSSNSSPGRSSVVSGGGGGSSSIGVVLKRTGSLSLSQPLVDGESSSSGVGRKMPSKLAM